MTVQFHDTVEDSLLKFAVIVARCRGQWVFCRHKARDTYEVPGGHREPGEPILATARRELYEETGAIEFELTPVCVYSVAGRSSLSDEGGITYGMLYRAEIRRFAMLPDMEIAEVALFDELPQPFTYPDIQPHLIVRACACGEQSAEPLLNR